MPYIVPIDEARKLFPNFKFISALTPSEQKAAFHVKSTEGNDYCLKIISPDYALDRLNREIIALQSLSHPNIVRLIEYTFTSKPGNQRHYMVEEFVAGNDLFELIGKNNPWPIDKASLFFVQLFDGLEVLNSKNLVHRDLKPKNIRVRNNLSPVIIDFGVVRHLNLDDLTRTDQGAALGTPYYFAPEQFKGNKHDIDHRTDIFAAGLLLYESLVGHHPFHTNMNSYQELMDAVCSSEEYTLDSHFQSLPRDWKILLNRTLSKDRLKRPSASQVAKIIRNLGGVV